LNELVLLKKPAWALVSLRLSIKFFSNISIIGSWRLGDSKGLLDN
jgi:hypothetical protein